MARKRVRIKKELKNVSYQLQQAQERTGSQEDQLLKIQSQLSSTISENVKLLQLVNSNTSRIQNIEEDLTAAENRIAETEKISSGDISPLISNIELLTNNIGQLRNILEKAVEQKQSEAYFAEEKAMETRQAIPVKQRTAVREEGSSFSTLLKAFFTNPAVIAAVSGIVYAFLPKDVKEKITAFFTGFMTGGEKTSKELSNFEKALMVAGSGLALYLGAKVLESIGEALETVMSLIAKAKGTLGKLKKVDKKKAAVVGAVAVAGAGAAAVAMTGGEEKPKEEKPQPESKPAPVSQEVPVKKEQPAPAKEEVKPTPSAYQADVRRAEKTEPVPVPTKPTPSAYQADVRRTEKTEPVPVPTKPKPAATAAPSAPPPAGGGTGITPGAAPGGGITPGAAAGGGIKPTLTTITDKQSGVDTEGLKAPLTERVAAMAADFKQKTGKKLVITSGFRSNEKQKELWDAEVARVGDPAIAKKKVAEPGPPLGKGRGSLHSSGLAIDINSKGAGGLNVLAGSRENSTGWLESFGLIRPIPGEDWHVQLAKTPPSPDNPTNPGAPILVPKEKGSGATNIASGKSESVKSAKQETAGNVVSSEGSAVLDSSGEQVRSGASISSASESVEAQSTTPSSTTSSVNLGGVQGAGGAKGQQPPPTIPSPMANRGSLSNGTRHSTAYAS